MGTSSVEKHRLGQILGKAALSSLDWGLGALPSRDFKLEAHS